MELQNTMKTIDINCDLGEGLSNDALVMPYISSANIACGYHAGDDSIMKRTIELAIANKVSIGAHPGFLDKNNFGRTEMNLPLLQIYDLVTEQINSLEVFAKSMGAKVRHVKPHGALYNMSAKNPAIASTISEAVFTIDPRLVLFGLSGSYSISEAKAKGLITAAEVFADRTYRDDGSLTPRTASNAMIESVKDSLQQVFQLINTQTVTTITGKQLLMEAETICIHGDGDQPVTFAKNIFEGLQKQSYQIKPKLN